MSLRHNLSFPFHKSTVQKKIKFTKSKYKTGKAYQSRYSRQINTISSKLLQRN